MNSTYKIITSNIENKRIKIDFDYASLIPSMYEEQADFKHQIEDVNSKIEDVNSKLEKLSSIFEKKDEIKRWKADTDNVNIDVEPLVKKTEDIYNNRKSGKYDMSDCKDLVEKCNAKLDRCYDGEDIRIQIQYATIILKRIDNMRKLDCLKANSSKMKALALIRMVIKLNMNHSILTEEQINVLKGAFNSICEDNDKTIISLSRSFRGVGLETMPSWE